MTNKAIQPRSSHTFIKPCSDDALKLIKLQQEHIILSTYVECLEQLIRAQLNCDVQMITNDNRVGYTLYPKEADNAQK